MTSSGRPEFGACQWCVQLDRLGRSLGGGKLRDRGGHDLAGSVAV